MGLVDILSKKLKAAKYVISRAFTKNPKDFIYKDFRENFVQNDKLVGRKWKKILSDANVIKRRKEVQYYISDVNLDLGGLTLDIMEITNSERFSTNFADFVTCVKLYAANYIATDKGKSSRERSVACARLIEIMDCLNFNLMTHINIETTYSIEPDGDNITIQKKKMSEDIIKALERTYDLKINQEEGYVFKLVMMQNKINTEIEKIIEGIAYKNRDMVFEGYINLCDKEYYQLPENYKEEFGLQ